MEASEGFEALAHPIRMGVLRALFEAEEPTMRFSELRAAVDAEDSGNFNYHLDRLTGLYVEKEGGTYRLTERGFEVGIALASGAYGEGESAERIESFGRCLRCDSPTDAVFERGTSVLECPNGHRTYVARLPSEGVEARGRESLAALVATELYATVGRTLRGSCSACRCPVDGELETTEEGVLFRADCDFCGVEYAVPAGLCALQDSEIVRFLDQRGADPRETPPWAFDCCFVGAETVESERPLRVSVTVAREGDERTVVLTEAGAVHEVRKRRPR